MTPAMSVVTVLRGGVVGSRSTFAASGPTPPRDTVAAPNRAIASPTSSGELTIDGVPISASQHCCGRGCKHCRIYWHHLRR